MKYKIGIIGTGNMGRAIIGGIISSGFACAGEIIVSDKNPESLSLMEKDFPGIDVTADNCRLSENSEIIILAVKPDIYKYVLDEINKKVSEKTVIVTIAAGITVESVEKYFSFPVKVIRTMPNTPALVGEGMSVLCRGRNVTDEELGYVEKIFQSFGLTEVIDEKYIDVCTAVSGSSPAYVYMFIEALADGAVLEGLPRATAYKLASQAVLGSARVVRETGKHPGELKDMVCSPGGTTIEAVQVLEKNSFRYSVIDAVRACREKASKLG